MAKFENRVRYSLYTVSDSDEMVQLLGQVFTQRDPPAIATGLTPSEFEAFVRLLCPKAEAEGLTIIARSSETAEMMGASLAEDSASAAPPGMDRLSAKFNPIFDILGQLDAAYRSDRSVKVGESLHLFLLGVAERFAGQGIAQQLVAGCVANGAHKGYRVAVTEAPRTGLRSISFENRVSSSACSGPNGITGSSAKLSLHRSPNMGGPY